MSPRKPVSRRPTSVVPAGSATGAPRATSALSASTPWSYAPAPESRDIVSIRPRYGLFIDGRERAPIDGEVTVTFNPATEEPLAEIAKGSPADADRAIAAAERAHRKVWSDRKSTRLNSSH